MAKTNYTYEKRQRDIAKKQKQEEKRLKKVASKDELPQDGTPQDGAAQDAAMQPPVDESLRSSAFLTGGRSL